MNGAPCLFTLCVNIGCFLMLSVLVLTMRRVQMDRSLPAVILRVLYNTRLRWIQSPERSVTRPADVALATRVIPMMGLKVYHLRPARLFLPLWSPCISSKV